jgi:RNase P subunit RPR2
MDIITLCRKCKQPAQPLVTVTKTFKNAEMINHDIFCLGCTPIQLPPGYSIINQNHLS